jgi:hypothetical protein
VDLSLACDSKVNAVPARGAKNTLVAARRAEFQCKRQHTSRGKQIFFSPRLSQLRLIIWHTTMNQSDCSVAAAASVRIRNPLLAASNFSAAYLGIISMGLIKSHRRASTVKLFFLSPSFKIPKMRCAHHSNGCRSGIFFGSWVYWATKLVHLNSRVRLFWLFFGFRFGSLFS